MEYFKRPRFFTFFVYSNSVSVLSRLSALTVRPEFTSFLLVNFCRPYFEVNSVNDIFDPSKTKEVRFRGWPNFELK